DGGPVLGPRSLEVSLLLGGRAANIVRASRRVIGCSSRGRLRDRRETRVRKDTHQQRSDDCAAGAAGLSHEGDGELTLLIRPARLVAHTGRLDLRSNRFPVVAGPDLCNSYGERMLLVVVQRDRDWLLRL